jgi:hypothetical protein
MPNNQITIMINKTGQEVSITPTELPETSKAFIFAYGLKQILNDCHSSIKQSEYGTLEEFHAAVNEVVNNKLDAIVSGTITQRTSGNRIVSNPIEKIVLRLAREAIKAALKRAGKTASKEVFDSLVGKYIIQSGDKLAKQAQAELKRAADFSNEIDISELEG